MSGEKLQSQADHRVTRFNDLLQAGTTMSVDDVRDSLSELTQMSKADLQGLNYPEVTFANFLLYLQSGDIRAAEPITGEDGKVDWQVNPWVKEGIVKVGFPLGDVVTVSAETETLQFSDKHTLPTLDLSDASERNVRIVPGGSSIRAGSHIGDGVIMMPPSYVNIGAYVGDKTMIDSFALVGSAAQIGERVHIAAGAKVGGVLEPANARPCIVEDDVWMLGDSAIYEGVMLKRGSVLAPNVILSSGIEVWERTEDGDFNRLENTSENPISIPERALVIPGTRILDKRDGTPSPIGKNIALIAGYYPEGGNPNLALTEALR